MYAGVEEGGGAAAEPEGSMPYIGFGGSTCKDTTGNLKPCFQIRQLSLVSLERAIERLKFLVTDNVS